jgi:hypothetical protein
MGAAVFDSPLMTAQGFQILARQYLKRDRNGCLPGPIAF